MIIIKTKHCVQLAVIRFRKSYKIVIIKSHRRWLEKTDVLKGEDFTVGEEAVLEERPAKAKPRNRKE